MRVTRFGILPGTLGTVQSVWAMRSLARSGRWHPLVRETAMLVVRSAGRDAHEQAYALRDWLDSNVHFLRDPDDIEALHTPEAMLRLLLTHGPPLAIDCDDAAILAAALGGAVGLKSRFVVVGISPSSSFRHVWTELTAPHGPQAGEWWEMDVTRAAQSIPVSAITRRWAIPV